LASAHVSWLELKVSTLACSLGFGWRARLVSAGVLSRFGVRMPRSLNHMRSVLTSASALSFVMHGCAHDAWVQATNKRRFATKKECTLV
jgi:hypothetical protein